MNLRDKITVINPHSVFIGRQGVIIDCARDYRLVMLEGKPNDWLWFKVDELSLT